jgi:hypothetical protein
MEMRTLSSLTLCLALLSPSAVLSALSGQPPFSIKIAQADIAKSGAEILVEIALTNTADHEISVGKAPGNLPQAESEYLVEAFDSEGQTAPDTDYGRKIKQNKIVVSFSRVSATIEPGGSLKDGVILTKLYNLSRPGKYSVQLLRRAPRQLGGGLIKSNTITITVTE